MTPTRSRRGAYTLELALTLPFWLALVAGIADTAWLLHQRAQLAAAVHEGCRAGALVDPGDAGERLDLAEGAARDRMLTFLGTLDPNGCPTCSLVVRLEGARPARRLVCDATAEGRALTTRWFAPTTVRVTRSSVLAWQRGAAP